MKKQESTKMENEDPGGSVVSISIPIPKKSNNSSKFNGKILNLHNLNLIKNSRRLKT
jgi:hypothetical protein